MNWSDIPRDPSPRVLRQFAGLWLLSLGFLAWRLGLPAQPDAVNLGVAGLALSVGVLGLAWPRSVRELFLGLTVATLPLGWIVSRVLLGVLFFGVFTPLAVSFRILGRDALALRPAPHRDSYWVPRAQAADPR